MNFFIFLQVLLATTVTTFLATADSQTTTVILPISPRQQWCYSASCSHVGYCGETAFQSAALYYGNYISQEVVRNSDGPCSNQQKLTGECQLLVAVNDVTAAQNLRLRDSTWPYASTPIPQAAEFLKWIRSSLDSGFPVIAGFYAVGGTDRDYDHIIIIMGYSRFSNGTVSTIYWNDFLSSSTKQVSVSKLFQTRSLCTSALGTQGFCLPKNYNYGIRIEGNQGSTNEILRASLQVSSWNEPDYSSEDQVSPKPSPILLSSNLTLQNVQKGIKYSILRFDGYVNVPMSSFLSSTKIAKRYCLTSPANGTVVYSVPDKLLSNSSYFFRVLRDNSCVAK